MRTLKNGKEVKYYAICSECSSHIEYDYDDMKKPGGASTGGRYIVCPVCEERISVRLPAANPVGSAATSLAVGLSSIGSCGCS